jgi:hypothetical protein
MQIEVRCLTSRGRMRASLLEGHPARRSPGIKSSRRSCEAVTAMRSRKLPSKTIAWWKSESSRKELRPLGDGQAASRYHCAYTRLKAGLVKALSVGFQLPSDSFSQKDGIRVITRVVLKEISLVIFGANTLAAVATVKEQTPQSPLRPLLQMAMKGLRAGQHYRSPLDGELETKNGVAPSPVPDVAFTRQGRRTSGGERRSRRTSTRRVHLGRRLFDLELRP